jgi:hypothetical protein
MKLKKKILKVNKKRKKKKPYFGKEAHAAVVAYQLSDSKSEKNEIYEIKIRPSFEKLTENLIFIHGFSANKEHFQILKADCVSFLFQILEKFDVSKGSKAFSYFNVCAKNFLIIQSKKRSKRRNRLISLCDEGLSYEDKRAIENSQLIPSQEKVLIAQEDKSILNDVLIKIRNKLTNNNEILCCNAIIALFKKINDLDFLNKRAIFVYLRELSGLNAKQLSVAMSNIRKQYREIKKSDDIFILFANID